MNSMNVVVRRVILSTIEYVEPRAVVISCMENVWTVLCRSFFICFFCENTALYKMFVTICVECGCAMLAFAYTNFY